MKRASPSAAPTASETRTLTQDSAAKRGKEEEKREEQRCSIVQEDAAKKTSDEEEIEVVDAKGKSSPPAVKGPKRQLLSLNPGLDSPSTSLLNREVASSDVPPRKIFKALTPPQQMQEMAASQSNIPSSNPYGDKSGYPFSFYQHQQQQQFYPPQQFAPPLSIGVPTPAPPVPNLLTLANIALQYGQLPPSSSGSSSSSPVLNSQNFYKYSQSGGGCYIDPSYQAPSYRNQTYTTSSAQTTISSSTFNKQRQNMPPPPPYHQTPTTTSSSSSSSSTSSTSATGRQPHLDSLNAAYGNYHRLRQMGVKPLIDVQDVNHILINRSRDPQAYKRIEFFTHLTQFNANVLLQTLGKCDPVNFRNNRHVRENYLILLNSIGHCIVSIKNILNGLDLK